MIELINFADKIAEQINFKDAEIEIIFKNNLFAKCVKAYALENEIQNTYLNDNVLTIKI